jgi:hypothetical protein
MNMVVGPSDVLGGRSSALDWALQVITHERKRIAMDHNAQQPIFRLPLELFEFIFLSCLPAITPRCLSFAQVCSTWRSIALRMPHIWTSSLFDWPSFAKLMLQRTQSRPLSIRLDCRPQSHYFSTRSLNYLALRNSLAHLPTFREVDISGPGDDMAEIVYQLAQPAPLLERFHVALRSEGTTWTRAALISSSFLGNHAPRLKSMHTIGFLLQPDSNLYLNLTELLMTSGWGWVSMPIPFLISVLRRTQQLERLVLAYSMTEFASQPQPVPEDVVALKHLRSVQLSGQLPFPAMLLEFWALPPGAHVRVDGDQEASPVENFLSTFALLGARPSLHLLEAFGLTFTVRRRHVTVLIAGDPTGHIDFRRTAFMHVQGRWDAGAALGSHVFKELVQAMPIAAVRALKIDVDRLEDCPFTIVWSNALRSLSDPQLCSVTVRGLVALGFITGFYHAHSTSALLPLPRLRIIVIECPSMHWPVILETGATIVLGQFAANVLSCRKTNWRDSHPLGIVFKDSAGHIEHVVKTESQATKVVGANVGADGETWGNGLSSM